MRSRIENILFFHSHVSSIDKKFRFGTELWIILCQWLLTELRQTERVHYEMVRQHSGLSVPFRQCGCP